MSSELWHEKPATDAQVEAVALGTQVDGGRRAALVPHDDAKAHSNYLREHSRELGLLLRIRREYMGDAPLP